MGGKTHYLVNLHNDKEWLNTDLPGLKKSSIRVPDEQTVRRQQPGQL
jgi:hypothetical protein